MKRRNIILIVVFILLITGGVMSWFLFTSPIYSLYKTKRAIEKHDYAMFLKYNNPDSMINNFINKISLNQLDSNDKLEKLEIELLKSIPFGLKPQMTLIINKQLKKLLEKGTLENLFLNKNKISIIENKPGNLTNLINLININKNHNTAIIGVNFRTDDKGKKFSFRIRMRRTGNQWQVVELMDFLKLKL